MDSSDSKLILMKVTLKLTDMPQLNIENYKLNIIININTKNNININ